MHSPDYFHLITADKFSSLKKLIDDVPQEVAAFFLLDQSCPKGELPFRVPANIYVLDLRYNGALNLIRGNHPRLGGFSTQYAHHNTGLGRNIVISDVLSDETKIENWNGERSKPVDAPLHALTSEEYCGQHNHYQNFLSEVFNFSRNVNGVAIWGDSGAFVPESKAWGGFFSARSWPLQWREYVPENRPEFSEKDFDAALVGVEVDVLNNGLDHGQIAPGLTGPLSKIGVQIVGFGRQNTAALEVRCEDTDTFEMDPDLRRGTWKYGLIFNNSLNSRSTVVKTALSVAAKGIDLSDTLCNHGAFLLQTRTADQGILLNEGRGGQIFAQQGEGGDVLVVRSGTGGLRITDVGGEKVFLEVLGNGSLVLSDDALAGLKTQLQASTPAQRDTSPNMSPWTSIRGLATSLVRPLFAWLDRISKPSVRG